MDGGGGAWGAPGNGNAEPFKMKKWENRRFINQNENMEILTIIDEPARRPPVDG